MSRHSLSFILNKEEEEDTKMQDCVFGDFTSQPGSSNSLSFAPKTQPQPQQPARQPPSLSAFLPFVALVHSTSAFEVVNPKKRKAASLSASSAACLGSNKQRRLETTTAPSTTSALKEEVLEHLRTIQERAVRAQRQQHSQHNASSPQREEDAVTCRRNKMLAQQLLRETTFQPNANPDESNGLGKVKRATPEQVAFLERLFVLDPLPSTVTRRMIAEKLGMTPKKVQIWFQNKRARVKTDVPSTFNNNSTSTSTTTTTEDNDTTKQQQKKRTRRIAPRTSAMLVFHNLGICADGQLVLCSEGVPPLMLNPALSRDHTL